MSMVLAAIGNIESLINGLMGSVWVIYGLAFGAAIILRITKRNEERPYKVNYILMYVHYIAYSILGVDHSAYTDDTGGSSYSDIAHCAIT